MTGKEMTLEDLQRLVEAELAKQGAEANDDGLVVFVHRRPNGGFDVLIELYTEGVAAPKTGKMSVALGGGSYDFAKDKHHVLSRSVADLMAYLRSEAA